MFRLNGSLRPYLDRNFALGVALGMAVFAAYAGKLFNIPATLLSLACLMVAGALVLLSRSSDPVGLHKPFVLIVLCFFSYLALRVEFRQVDFLLSPALWRSPEDSPDAYLSKKLFNMGLTIGPPVVAYLLFTRSSRAALRRTLGGVLAAIVLLSMLVLVTNFKTISGLFFADLFEAKEIYETYPIIRHSFLLFMGGLACFCLLYLFGRREQLVIAVAIVVFMTIQILLIQRATTFFAVMCFLAAIFSTLLFYLRRDRGGSGQQEGDAARLPAANPSIGARSWFLGLSMVILVSTAGASWFLHNEFARVYYLDLINVKESNATVARYEMLQDSLAWEIRNDLPKDLVDLTDDVGGLEVSRTLGDWLSFKLGLGALDGDNLRTKVFGLGLGSYAYVGKNFYPHNVLAESYVEQGILGFSLLAVLLLYPFIAFLRRTTIYVQPIYLFFVLGAGSYLLHMMKSGDISRLGLFLFLSGVVLAITDGLPTRKNLLKAPL